MKFFQFIFCIVLFVLAISCKKKESCPYQIDILSDTDLYVSYEMNGIQNKYYQRNRLPNLIFGGNIEGIGSASVRYCKYSGIFYAHQDDFSNSLQWCFLDYQVPPDLILASDSPWLVPYNPLSQKLKVNKKYKFTDIKYFSDHELIDTVFMNGFNLTLNTYSVANIMEYYEYDYDKIYGNILNLNDSYCIINNIEQVCDHYFLVKGTFTTKLMNTVRQDEPPEIVEIKNGRFQILTN